LEEQIQGVAQPMRHLEKPEGKVTIKKTGRGKKSRRGGKDPKSFLSSPEKALNLQDLRSLEILGPSDTSPPKGVVKVMEAIRKTGGVREINTFSFLCSKGPANRLQGGNMFKKRIS